MEDDVQTLIRALKDKKPALYQEWKASGSLEAWAWAQSEEIQYQYVQAIFGKQKELAEKGVNDLQMVQELNMTRAQAHEIALAQKIEEIEAL